jgi:putative SOS response-associated peptidase YedK
MCGRFEVNSNIVDLGVFQTQKIRFHSINNHDQRPTQNVVCLHHHHGKIEQTSASWGIKPEWADRSIINAQSETAASKKTFSSAYALHRCVIPCSAWFEWTGKEAHKTKHRFSHLSDDVLFMAGILFPQNKNEFKLVTLTCKADSNCNIYHHRMPFIIESNKVEDWLALPHLEHELNAFNDSHPIKVIPPLLTHKY